MNRTSWLILAGTAFICALLSFFYLKPAVTSALTTRQKTNEAQKELNEISQKKEILNKFTQNDQLKNLYQAAAAYIPEEADSGDLIIELTAIAGQNNLKVEQISLEPAKTSTNQNTETKTNQPTTQTPADQTINGIKIVDFTIKIAGTFNDFLNFLESTEISGRLMNIPVLSLTQSEGGLTSEVSGQAYWKKGTSLEKNLANINISQATIQKFQNLKTYGTPINLTTEAGFGRTNPFDSIK